MNDELFGIRDVLGFVPYIGDVLDIADVGYDNGNIRFIDADVYKKGGKLLLRKFT